MKYLFLVLFTFHFLFFSENVVAQPNVCITPPNGYTLGGSFDLTVVRDNNVIVDDYLCLSEKVAVEQIGVIDKSTLLQSSVRYIFGVDNSTVIPSLIPLSTTRNIDGQSVGEFWVMQLGEENGIKKLNCKKMQIDVSEKPELKLDMSNCTIQAVTLNISSANPVNHYVINWNDGSPVEKINYQNTILKVPHTFSQSTADFIEVTGVFVNTTLNRTCNSKAVTIIPPPFFYIKSLETQDSGGILNANLIIQNPKGINLELFVSENNGITYSKRMNVSSSALSINNSPKKDLCFKLKSLFGSCLYESEAVCMINPTADNSKPGQINLQWNSVGRNTSYEVKRTGGTPLQISNLTTTSFLDKTLNCNVSYLYQVMAEYVDINNNPTKIVSHLVKSSFISNSLPKQVLVATISNEGRPQLDILDTNGDVRYIIYRSINGESFAKIDETKDNKYLDTGNANLDQYCYYVKHIDECGNLSVSSPTVCTIFLKNDFEQLNWNKPIESQQVKTINYEVIQLNPIQVLTSQLNNSFTITDVPNRQVQVQIKATVTIDISGKIYVLTTLSNQISIDFNTNLNDILVVKGDFMTIKDFEMLIFNQWGETIFESKDINLGWDGTLNTEKVQSGFYTVVIAYRNRFGLFQRRTDKIMLLR